MKKGVTFLAMLLLSASCVFPQSEAQLTILQRWIKPLYRNPDKKELAAIAPNPALLTKYALFLSRAGTGLTRLAEDSGCSDNLKVVVATDDCLKYTMPGAGYSYSFRIRNYRLPSLADLIYTEKSFQASGVLLHGVLVNVGDVPIESVTLRTEGVKYLVDFQPVTDYDEAKETDKILIEGVVQDGFVYRRGLRAVADATYVLRSIAYDGTHYRAVRGITYNELDFDKRQDIVVAFRIVEQGEDGSVTILWKELSRKRAPKIRGLRKVKRME